MPQHTPSDRWFTVEAIDADTYAISEYAHWEEPHCYLLNGDRASLLIDTGLGVGQIAAVAARLSGLCGPPGGAGLADRAVPIAAGRGARPAARPAPAGRF